MSEPLIVVPLDCSELSESAVPYASAMAQATGAHLLLLTIWEEGERALITDLPDLAEDLFKRGEEHYEGYLAGVAKKVEAEGVEVEADVLLGDPTEEILRAIEQRDPRLLVMATHGRSGLSRWRYGSVASKLAREAPVPTMMVGPNVVQDGARVDAVRRILVPLDGSPLAESAIRPALELAEALDAGLLLAQVLSWANQAFVYGAPDYAVQDVDIARIDRELTAGAQQYLARAKEGLVTQRPTETVVLHGPAADGPYRLSRGAADRSGSDGVAHPRCVGACRTGQRRGPAAPWQGAGAADPPCGSAAPLRPSSASSVRDGRKPWTRIG